MPPYAVQLLSCVLTTLSIFTDGIPRQVWLNISATSPITWVNNETTLQLQIVDR